MKTSTHSTIKSSSKKSKSTSLPKANPIDKLTDIFKNIKVTVTPYGTENF
jgi:hypothetical protein